MPQEFSIYINLRPEASLVDCLFAVLEAVDGFFLPHTAFTTSLPPGASQGVPYGIGGYRDWEGLQIPRSDLRIGDFDRLLPAEREGPLPHWTMAEYPDCREELRAVLSEWGRARWWDLCLFGNTKILTEDGTEQWLFREAFRYPQRQSPIYNPLLQIRSMTGSITRYDPAISFNISSDVWHENIEGFGGDMCATVQQNTNALVERLIRVAHVLESDIVEISGCVEDPIVNRVDANRIWKALKAIPGLVPS